MVWKSYFYLLVVTGIFFTLCSGCKKHAPEPTPIPLWENLGADSVRLNIIVQNQQGVSLSGLIVNMALSEDSLTKGILVRQTGSDGFGRAVMARLYPEITYTFNCYASYTTFNLYGHGSIYLPSIPKLDTIVFLTLF